MLYECQNPYCNWTGERCDLVSGVIDHEIEFDDFSGKAIKAHPIKGATCPDCGCAEVEEVERYGL